MKVHAAMTGTSQHIRWLAIERELRSRSQFNMPESIATRWWCAISFEVDWTLALSESYTEETETLANATSAGEEVYLLHCCGQDGL